MPEISVVIPLYNKGQHIARTINSVLAQTFQDFEIIIIDGNSSDDGPDIVQGYSDPRIRLYPQYGSGVSAARNQGVEGAYSDFISFLDADDEWVSNHLETLMRLRQSFPDAGAYTTAYSIKTCDYPERLPNISGIPNYPWEGLIPNYIKSVAHGDSPVWTSVVAIPKEIFMEMGGFNPNEWWGEDMDLWLRIALKYPIAFSWNGQGIYHTEATNRITNRRKPITENIAVTTASNALQEGQIPLHDIEDLQKFISNKSIETAILNIARGHPDLARENLKKCQTRSMWKTKYLVMFLSYIPEKIYLLLKRARINNLIYCTNEILSFY